MAVKGLNGLVARTPEMAITRKRMACKWLTRRIMDSTAQEQALAFSVAFAGGRLDHLGGL